MFDILCLLRYPPVKAALSQGKPARKRLKGLTIWYEIRFRVLRVIIGLIIQSVEQTAFAELNIWPVLHRRKRRSYPCTGEPLTVSSEQWAVSSEQFDQKR